ncbi:TPA: PTS sugar transporter subunit IIA [Listeria monocytogenes]|uniref:PTS sugar transporter subunit IIA n=1 Tax=Listeria monocytogenes TaxID=1639 RepID=UPI00083CEC95|nr:PTS sugar transporter subunit IIA [Listeria monocytogenes]EAE5343503.1 PTS sugar transporter subunit IIA [Listeria monocytogenes]EAG7360483.1 PTS sugar transporter subunit IIA [Listeria monocytogenes]EED2543899.1 PTS sugar transporter subunit IIA [Listeria monocytogenes]EFJ1556549.1 PTS sugar transporter subunit IIA [Listeria monocytogenes]EIT3537849.1 PTS sugar transporter subunit IIA [Listeria monocytogenes]
MKAIFVCTHGNAAKELIQSAEMICGKQENTSFVPFEVNESAENLQAKIASEVAKLDLTEGILFLTDLKGGTPFNVLVRLLGNFDAVELVAGVNIPLLLEAFLSRETLSLKQLANQVAETGRLGIYEYAAPLKEIEEDF